MQITREMASSIVQAIGESHSNLRVWPKSFMVNTSLDVRVHDVDWPLLKNSFPTYR